MSSKGSFKRESFQDRILEEINLALRGHFADSRLTFVSITKVEVSPDFSFAKVYWDTYDSKTRGDAKKAVDRIKGKMRSILASKLKVRHVPELAFYYDSQFEDEKKIEELLDSEAKLGKGFE